MAVSFTHEEIRRYSRHLIMPEVGLEGQAKLKEGSALVVGAGGLGSPVCLYLSAAGIGRIGIVDFDAVEESNLQRQVMFTGSDIGRPKVEVARERMLALNPNIQVDAHRVRLTSDNAMQILKGYDVIIDGTDNFPTRYLVNDACVLLGRPNVYGSIFRFDGQASVFWGEKGPCYRCLYREPPPPGLVPSCAEGGVLGILPGIIGVVQATETIKILTGRGEPLVGRLLLYDALGMRFRELRLQKDPECPICSEHRSIESLIDYEEFCGVSGETSLDVNSRTTPKELSGMLASGKDIVLLDVRERSEYEICHLDGAALIPLRDLPFRVKELSTSDDIVVYCHVGDRSVRAVEFLRQLGFEKVRDLEGGIDRWAREVEPSMPRY